MSVLEGLRSALAGLEGRSYDDNDLAAILLVLIGSKYISSYRNSVPEEALERLNLRRWFSEGLDDEQPRAGDVQASLREVLEDAYSKGNREADNRLLRKGLKSDLPRVRACALVSAYDVGILSNSVLWRRLEWFLNRAELVDYFTASILTALLSRVAWSSGAEKVTNARPVEARLVDPTTRRPKAVAVHGTAFPPLRELFFPSFPPSIPFDAVDSWSTKASPLTNYLEGRGFSFVDGGETFKWEGSYSRCGRNCAGRNLASWLEANPDVGTIIAHSHGSSVLSVALAYVRHLPFDKIYLLHSPVRAEYKFEAAAAKEITSMRLLLDLVLVADRRGVHRFEEPHINEVVVFKCPFRHSYFCSPSAWQEVQQP